MTGCRTILGGAGATLSEPRQLVSAFFGTMGAIYRNEATGVFQMCIEGPENDHALAIHTRQLGDQLPIAK
jgi:hypothetical protein